MCRRARVAIVRSMLTLTLRRRARTALTTTLATGLALAALAPGAHAGLSRWTSLPGLSAAGGASWVRDYEFAAPATVYASTEGSGVYRSTDAGLTWRPFNDGLMEIPGGRDVRSVLASGSTVLAGTGAGLFRSTNGGAWTPLAQEPEIDPSRPIRLHRAVQRLFRQGATLLAGTQSGGVYTSTDDGATWTPPAPGNGMPSATTVWDLDALIPGIVFAATSNGVFRSADAGATWTPASDGVSGVVLRIFKDPANPNIFYAGTSDGVFRSVTLGATWSAVNGAGAHALGSEIVRALEPFVNGAGTRLYAGTGDGVWVGTTGNGPLPGPVRWRKVTENGLAVGSMPNDIVWALAPHLLPAGTLLLGTQSNGGYALTFEPPTSLTPPAISGDPRVGVKLTASPGLWSGTPSIELSYQWQRCTSELTSSCRSVDGATRSSYVPTDEDLSPSPKRLRVVVTAENDFPTIGLVQRASAITEPTAVHPDPARVPGATQQAAPTISAVWPADVTLPQSGDTLRSSLGLLNPVPDQREYTWWSCNAAGVSCTVVPGATGATFTLGDEHVDRRFKVAVTGTNAYGSGTTQPSGLTNVVFPSDPAVVRAPAVLGTPYVGETLVGNVGQWRYPGTTYARRWLRCDADGSCQTIAGQSGAVYVPTADDLGRRIKLEVTADSNGPDTFPPPVAVATAPTAPVTHAPVPQEPQPPAPPAPDAPLPPRMRTRPRIRIALPRTLKPGAKLTVPKRVRGFASARYQWYRDGRRIRRATRRTYKVTRKDRGRKLVCKITLTPRRGGRKVVKTTPAVRVPRR